MKPFIDADYAAIEARIVCWLAGQEDALDEYRQGIDRYKVMASTIYKIPIDEINKFPQRFIGKQTVLGCGFSMGPTKFRALCLKFGYELPMGLETIAVDTYRAKHQKVVRYWSDVDQAAKKAIMRKGEIVELRNIAFIHADIDGFPFLLMRLPSGRKLAYPRPKLIPGKWQGSTSIRFYGRVKGSLWGECHIYGAKLVENATQAVAADIMACGAHNAEKAGYEIATLIHDQALAYSKPGQTPEEFVKLLTDLPSWADGLPIEAEGGLVPFYKKD